MEKHKKLNGSLEEGAASTTALHEEKERKKKERKWLKKMTKPKVLDDGSYGWKYCNPMFLEHLPPCKTEQSATPQLITAQITQMLSPTHSPFPHIGK